MTDVCENETAIGAGMPSSSPAVSVIVPIHNAAETLHQTIGSVLDQTFEDFELILVNDGSTDDSASICRSFGDERIRYVEQENTGVSKARNTGLAMARGAFIGFLDSDDLWHPEKIASHVAHLRRKPNLGVSYSACRFIDWRGEPLKACYQPKLSGITAADVYCRNPIAGGSSAFFRRRIFDDIVEPASGDGQTDYFESEASDRGVSYAEDHQCWLRMALHSDLEFEGLEAFLTFYRIHDKGLSANIAAMHTGWRAIDDYVRRVAPALHRSHSAKANAYQMRYYARRAVALRDGRMALSYIWQSMQFSLEPFRREPVKSLTTCAAAIIVLLTPALGGKLLGLGAKSRLGASS